MGFQSLFPASVCIARIRSNAQDEKKNNVKPTGL